MINPREMVTRRAVEERSPPPLATDQEVQDTLHKKIETFRRCVENPVRFGHPTESNVLNPAGHLFTFTAEEHSWLEDEGGKRVRRVESDRLQALGLQVMRDYGLDDDKSIPMKGGYSANGNIGTSTEIRRYPSQNIKGLVFERIKTSIPATGETLSVRWEVMDNAPLLRLPIRDTVQRILRKKV